MLVTDYELRGLTGSQLCFILRDGLIVPPAILITGKDHELDLAWLRQEHKLVAILPKPVSAKLPGAAHCQLLLCLCWR